MIAIDIKQPSNDEPTGEREERCCRFLAPRKLKQPSELAAERISKCVRMGARFVL
jgi:hypothetical protein